MSNPLVSVIIPVYNGEEFLAEAVSSIRAQNYQPLEIILVDDGSTDGTAKVVQELGDDIRYLYQCNAGPAAARNRGFDLAHGEFIAFLDADDVWPADRLQHHLALFGQSPDTTVVIGTTRTVSLNQNIMPGLPVPMIQHHLGSATCHRAVFSQVGMLNPDLWYGEDREWFQRVLQQGIAIRTTRRIALEYRLRPGSLTFGRQDHRHFFLTALHADLKRRRQEPKPCPSADTVSDTASAGESHNDRDHKIRDQRTCTGL